MTHQEYSELQVQENIKDLQHLGQSRYMHRVRLCVLRENNVCGRSSSCIMCKHYKMVVKMLEEAEQIESDGPTDFYTICGTKKHINEYIQKFETEVKSVEAKGK